MMPRWWWIPTVPAFCSRGCAVVERRRALRALAWVAALLAVVALWSPAVRGGQQLGLLPQPEAGLSAKEFVDEALQAPEEAGFDGCAAAGVATADTGEPPPWFAEEVLDVDGARNLRANEDWSVAGFEVAGDLSSVMGNLSVQLEGRGWVIVESGAPGVLSGVKEKGVCQWLWLGGTSTGEETSVVVQTAAAP